MEPLDLVYQNAWPMELRNRFLEIVYRKLQLQRSLPNATVETCVQIGAIGSGR